MCRSPAPNVTNVRAILGTFPARFSHEWNSRVFRLAGIDLHEDPPTGTSYHENSRYVFYRDRPPRKSFPRGLATTYCRFLPSGLYIYVGALILYTEHGPFCPPQSDIYVIPLPGWCVAIFILITNYFEVY